MKILRCWCSNPTGGKLFAINLLFTTEQYKVDNIDNFVYYGKTRILHSLHPRVNYDITLDLHYVTCGAPPIDRQTADFQNRNDLSTRGTTDISPTESVARVLEFSPTG